MRYLIEMYIAEINGLLPIPHMSFVTNILTWGSTFILIRWQGAFVAWASMDTAII